MFNDIQFSKRMMERFRAGNEMKLSPVDLDVIVCSKSSWVNTRSITCKLPEDLRQAERVFVSAYTALPGKADCKVEWAADEGRAEVLVHFNPTTSKTLVVTTMMMLILLQFNKNKSITCSELVSMIGITKTALANDLLSLARPSVNVLQKKPPSKSLNDSDLFRLNPNFESPMFKLAVPRVVLVSEDTEEFKSATLDVGRQSMIDASIVRFMKTAKVMDHSELVEAVQRQLQDRFPVVSHMIKQRIELMLSADFPYIERDHDVRSRYKYIA
jgi:hypothetical protein